MNSQFSQLKRMVSFFSFLWPEFNLEKREFNKENVDKALLGLVFLLDALFKSENGSLKKNFPFPAGRSFFPGQAIPLMENVIAFLQSFNTQILSLNKNERQTFTFILENVIDYFRGMSQQDDEKSLRNLFVDFRFWIENLFKMFDQKVTGAIVANKKLALKNLFISGHPLQAELLYSSALVNFSLFPFMIQKGNQSLFLAGLDSRELVYVDPLSDEQMRAASSEGIKKLGEFCLANFAFGDWQLLDPQLREQDDPFLGKAEALALAFRHHEQRLFEESASVLNEAGFEDFNWPLLYLLQIKNLFNLGRMLEVKRLLQKFLIFYPYFAEGHELMGDVYQKEENLELALGFYEKALLINQNKGLSEKIKRLRETIEKNKNKPESQKSDLFYNISEAVLQSEERLIPRPKELRQMMEYLDLAIQTQRAVDRRPRRGQIGADPHPGPEDHL